MVGAGSSKTHGNKYMVETKLPLGDLIAIRSARPMSGGKNPEPIKETEYEILEKSIPIVDLYKSKRIKVGSEIICAENDGNERKTGEVGKVKFVKRKKVQ